MLPAPQIVEHCWHRQQCKVTGGGGEAAALTQFLTAFVPTFCRASNNLLDLRVGARAWSGWRVSGCVQGEAGLGGGAQEISR